MPGHTQHGSVKSRSRDWDPKGIVAVIDTNVLIAARLSKSDRPTASREIYRLAGEIFDSFTSPAILGEAELVLARPRFGHPPEDTRRWVDAFVRHSRQVNPDLVQGDFAAVLGGDKKDNHVLKAALAVNLYEEGQKAVEHAVRRDGCYIVSADTDFVEGRVVWGWMFISPEGFYRLLKSLRV